MSGSGNTPGVLLCRLEQHVAQFFYVQIYKVMTDLFLSKESSTSEIKAYFNVVLKLSQSDNEFPINLDEVWMLVYNRRDYATDALKKDFIENVDYKCTSVKTEVGSTRLNYRITVSCMEFFIARKVRPVFEVYRQVFHKVAKRELSRKELALMVIQAEEEKERLALENQTKQKQIEKLQPKAAFADCIMQSNDCISVGEMANILKQNGLFRKGQNALYEWLRWSGYLLSKGARYNLPSQRSISLGIMKIAENAQPQKGNVFINRKAVITPYGQRYFISLFSKGKNVGQCAISFTYK